MKLSEVTSAQFIAVNPTIKQNSKWDIIRWLVEFGLTTYEKKHPHKIDEDVITSAVESVIEREKSMTTGIGEHIAIPHASVTFLQKPLAILSIFPQGIDFESMDSQRVNVIILLLVPKDQFQAHIQTLSNIARLAHHSGFWQKISNMTDPQEVYQTIVDNESENNE